MHITYHHHLIKTTPTQARLVKQCQTKLAVKPRKAHAVLFYSQSPVGVLDRNSIHGACPVIEVP